MYLISRPAERRRDRDLYQHPQPHLACSPWPCRCQSAEFVLVTGAVPVGLRFPLPQSLRQRYEPRMIS